MQQPSRFKLWCFYLAFTVIVLFAIAQVETGAEAETNVDDGTAKTDKGWGLALSILSVIAMSVLLGAYNHPIYRNIIVGTKIEGIAILILLLFSTILVALISGPQRGLAVDSDGAVFVGNMYYFSWLSFFTGVLTLSSYVETVFGINLVQTMRNKSTSFTYWSALLVTSMIVMGTSADVYNRNCDVANEEKQQPFCSRTILAVVVGSIGTVFALVMIVLKIAYGQVPFLTEVSLTLSLFILYLVELAYVTDIDGPGSPLGNLYYFSWASFLLTFMVGKACYEDYVDAQHVEDQQQHVHEAELPTLANVNVDDDDDDGEEGNAVRGSGLSAVKSTVPSRRVIGGGDDTSV